METAGRERGSESCMERENGTVKESEWEMKCEGEWQASDDDDDDDLPTPVHSTPLPSPPFSSLPFHSLPSQALPHFWNPIVTSLDPFIGFYGHGTP